jgi:hypothetical protein
MLFKNNFITPSYKVTEIVTLITQKFVFLKRKLANSLLKKFGLKKRVDEIAAVSQRLVFMSFY